MFTKNGKSHTARIFFSFNVCSICFNFTTFCFCKILSAMNSPPPDFLDTIITRPNEPVPHQEKQSTVSALQQREKLSRHTIHTAQ
jgi:hypothetical protein